MNSEDIPEEILFINNFQYFLILTKILNNPTNSKPRKGYIVYFNYFQFMFILNLPNNKGRSVSRPLINNIQNITLFQKLRVKLRVVFCSFCRFLDFQLRVSLSNLIMKC